MKKLDNCFRILLVEDNPLDVILMRQALERWTKETTLHVVENGQDALDYIFAKDNYKDAKRPDLIILDLNLPKRNGKEILEEMRKNPGLESIKVVVVTTSDSESDKRTCYDLGVKLYLTKSMDFQAYLEKINSIQHLLVR
jgi:CheY-like chemotaxis protein